MTENPAYIQAIPQIITLKDVYGEWATVTNLTPKGYEAVGFRPPKKGMLEYFAFCFEVATNNCTDIDLECPRLILEKLPQPIIFNPSLFGTEATKLYGTDNIMLKVGYCLYGFMPKLSVGKGNVWALSPECKNICPKEDIRAFYQSLIWIYKES